MHSNVKLKMQFEVYLVLICSIATPLSQGGTLEQAGCNAQMSCLSEQAMSQIAGGWQYLCPAISDVYGYDFSFRSEFQSNPQGRLFSKSGNGTYIRRGDLQWADVTTTYPATHGDSRSVIRTWHSIGESQYYRGVQNGKGHMSVVESPAPLLANRLYGFPELDVYSELRRFRDFTSGLLEASARMGPPRDFWAWPAECREQPDCTWAVLLRRAPGREGINIAFRILLSSLAPDARLLGWDEGKMVGDSLAVRSSFRLAYSQLNGVTVPTAFRHERYKMVAPASDAPMGESQRILLGVMGHKLTRILSLDEALAAPMTLYLPPGSEIRTLDGNAIGVRETGREIHAD